MCPATRALRAVRSASASTPKMTRSGPARERPVNSRIALVSTQMGFIGFKAFAGAIVGGFGSIPGAVLGCLLIGVAEPFFDTAFPTLKGVGAYVIMFAVLLIRPQGLLSQMHAKKV